MQDADFIWFIENYGDLFSIYGQSFLAIKGKKVLGAYPSYAIGVRETLKNEALGTFIVQECNGHESAYTDHIASMNFLIQ